MKIGIVTEYYYPLLGGITENVHNTKSRLRRMGHEVKVITANGGHRHYATGESGLWDESDIIRIGSTARVYSNGSFAHVTIGLGLRAKMKRIMEEERFDLMHIHSPIVFTLPLFATIDARCPRVGTFHTYFDPSLAYTIWNGTVQRWLDGLDGQIAVSKTCIDALGRHFRLKARVIPNGVDVDEFDPKVRPIEAFQDGKRNLLFLSRFDPRNGLRLMIDAFERVKREIPDVRLIIVGDGPLKQYYKRFIPRWIARDIYFAGHVREDRARYYASCDVFCSPVMKASFGITLLEAMASGKPIVATENEGYRELLGPAEGLLLPKNDAAAFANAIVRLLEDPGLRARMGAAGRSKALVYSWDRITGEIARYYDEILAGRCDSESYSLAK
jgi:phosphatidylinositol alpha-mannosyltransferase